MSLRIDTGLDFLWHYNFQQKRNRDSGNARTIGYWQFDNCIHDASE